MAQKRLKIFYSQAKVLARGINVSLEVLKQDGDQVSSDITGDALPLDPQNAYMLDSSNYANATYGNANVPMYATGFATDGEAPDGAIELIVKDQTGVVFARKQVPWESAGVSGSGIDLYTYSNVETSVVMENPGYPAALEVIAARDRFITGVMIQTVKGIFKDCYFQTFLPPGSTSGGYRLNFSGQGRLTITVPIAIELV